MNSLRSRLAVAILSAAAIMAGFFGCTTLLQHAQFASAAADVQATREQLSTVEDLSTVFRHVGKVIEPSVVNINVTKTIKGVKHPSPDDLLKRFFHDQGDGSIPPGMLPPGDQPDNNGGNDNNGGDGDDSAIQMGTGSGVIIEAADGKGYILTNNHVAGGASELDITLSDGREIKGGKVLGTDPKSDLAVIEIKAERLIPARWGNSDDLEKGDWVLAFGSPFGYIGSMTHGIVSALNRHDVGIIGQNGYENFIQVDAPINPGNSGGPLVNMHGEVIGINTAIATRSGGFQGIGFAIPSNQAQLVYTQLKSKGKVVRGWLGISISDVAKNPDLAKKYFGYTGDTGVLVEQTFPDTPSYGKLQKGDIITSLNKQPVDNVQQLRSQVAVTAPGTTITLKVFRGGKDVDVPLTIGEQPEDISSLGHAHENGPGAAPTPGTAEAMGMKLSTLNDQTAEQLGLQDLKGGAVITGIDRNSLAAKSGLRPGDVITEVGNTKVETAQDAADAIGKLDAKKGIPLYVTSREGSRYVFIQEEQP